MVSLSEMKKPGGVFVIFFLQVSLRGIPPASSFSTHLLHYAGDNWWGEGWSQTHTSQPHSNAWGCHLFLWCDSALYRGCSHWNRRNINAVVINKQYLGTNMSTSITPLLNLFFTLSEGWQVYFNLCVRFDRVALGAGVRRTRRLHLVPIRVSAMMGWWCFLYSHEVGNVLVCATCLPPLLCGADEKGTFWTLSTYVTLQSKELTEQLWMLCLERPACKVAPWLAPENWDLGRALTTV